MTKQTGITCECAVLETILGQNCGRFKDDHGSALMGRVQPLQSSRHLVSDLTYKHKVF